MTFQIPAMDPQPRLTSQEQVYVQLRHAIMVGAIPTGTSLTIRGLADQLNLSPTPIREALRRLTSEGAIQALDNRRMRVPDMNAGRFDDLIATRITLECHAASRALPYVSDVIIGKMSKIDTEMDDALTVHDYDKLTVLNHSFHSELYCANPDQTAMPLVESIWLQLGPFQREAILEVEAFYQIDRHKEILSALRSRDGAGLVDAVRKDIEDGVASAGRSLIAARHAA